MITDDILLFLGSLVKKARNYGVSVTNLKLPPITSFAVGKTHPYLLISAMITAITYVLRKFQATCYTF